MNANTHTNTNTSSFTFRALIPRAKWDGFKDLQLDNSPEKHAAWDTLTGWSVLWEDELSVLVEFTANNKWRAFWADSIHSLRGIEIVRANYGR